MKIKIVNYQNSDYWYAKHIGEFFEVEVAKNNEYRVLPYDPNGDFYIDMDDCEIVDEAPKE